MNIIHKVTWKGMWKNRTRTLVTIFSVVMSAAMFMAVITGAYSLWNYSVQEQVAQGGDFFVQFDYASEEDTVNLKEEANARYVVDVGVLGYYRYTFDKTGRYLNYRVSAVDELFWEKMGLLLSEGRLPENSSEVLVPERFCELLGISVGDTVTLDMFSYTEKEAELPIVAEQGYQEFQTAYTVVGTMEEQDFLLLSEEVFQWAADTLITLRDGSEGEEVWHRLYAKTEQPGQAGELAEREYGEKVYLNQRLLNLYGLTEHANANWMILLMAIVAILIVMVAAVNPISNAFTVSVAERTKQFGLLSSIGQTKKQIRQSVLFEAVVICGVAIPIGLLIGYGTMAVVFMFWGSEGVDIFKSIVHDVEGNTVLRTTVSWPIVMIAIAVCIVTVLISAWIPARRASRLTPMEAIRQSEDIRSISKLARVGKLSQHRLGLPAVLARKYYHISRRTYRATTVALSVGLILFISTNYLTACYNMMADAMHTDSYDFYTEAQWQVDPFEYKEAIKTAPGIADAVVGFETRKDIIIPYTAYSEEWRNEVVSIEREDPNAGWKVTWISVAFIEDEVYEKALREAGINPEPYLRGEIAATTMTSNSLSLKTPEGERVSKKYYGPQWAEGAAIQVLSQDVFRVPEELVSKDWKNRQDSYEVNDQGQVILKAQNMELTEDGQVIEQVAYFLLEITEGETSNQRNYCYYIYDNETGERGELLLTTSAEVELLRTGACLDERPFGISVTAGIILPLSLLEEKGWKTESDRYSVMLKAENYKEALKSLDEYMEKYGGGSLIDEVEESQTMRNTTAIIRIIANSIVLLITLTSAVNVFNVISANLALRRRDFAMLRSMGMPNSGIDQMLVIEGILYGSWALIWSIPIGLMICYGIYRTYRVYYVMTVGFPWQTVLGGIVAVFLILLVSVSSVMRKIHKDNVIDAIRMENL